MTFNDKDPPWKNDFVRNKIKWKNKIHSSFVYKILQEAIDLVSGIINKRENNYNGFIAKLNNSKTNAKT